jgi:hypothetical protein
VRRGQKDGAGEGAPAGSTHPWRKSRRKASSAVVPYSQIRAGWPSLRTGQQHGAARRRLARRLNRDGGKTACFGDDDGGSCPASSWGIDATAAAAPDTSVVTLPGAVSAAVISAALTAGARATTSSIITKWW